MFRMYGVQDAWCVKVAFCSGCWMSRMIGVHGRLVSRMHDVKDVWCLRCFVSKMLGVLYAGCPGCRMFMRLGVSDAYCP